MKLNHLRFGQLSAVKKIGISLIEL